jgi:uncharacterized protein YceH (UPF0502 family)
MNDEASPTDATPRLTETEARLLGCLIEKEATTPDVYPLTINAAQSAANQKTAREPVMNLDPGAVNYGLRQLEQKGLARQVFSSRAERYEHRAASYFNVPQQQVVLLGLLLLRGAQTAHELLARSDRLHRFADADDLRHQLERLIQRDLLVQIPRGPGQREDRYMHLLCGPVDVAAISARVPTSPEGGAESLELAARVQQLENEVAQLREQLAQLRSSLGG